MTIQTREAVEVDQSIGASVSVTKGKGGLGAQSASINACDGNQIAGSTYSSPMSVLIQPRGLPGSCELMNILPAGRCMLENSRIRRGRIVPILCRIEQDELIWLEAVHERKIGDCGEVWEDQGEQLKTQDRDIGIEF